VKAYCGASLARYKVPVRVVPIEAFPTTMSANGIKIQKAKLREKASAILSTSE
jgi:fatty-acyl-CoA synthase